MAARPGVIAQFIDEAKQILATSAPLDQQKEAIGKKLEEISRRDDLLRFGLPIGPADGCTQNYLLWREPPHLIFAIAQFDPGYISPVHEHGDFWVVACGYRGQDRWDMYERVDDGSQAGYAEVRKIGEKTVPPGKSVWMPKPPRAIHAHNNEAPGHTMELIFSASRPPELTERLIYDVDAKACWPSAFRAKEVVTGDYYPPRVAARQSLGLSKILRLPAVGFGRLRQAFCPVCMAMDGMSCA